MFTKVFVYVYQVFEAYTDPTEMDPEDTGADCLLSEEERVGGG